MSGATVVQEFAARVAAMPERVALDLLSAGGASADTELTWSDWDDASRAFAAALIRAGVQRGEAVAILADNDLLWPIADIGTLRAGCVSVGIFPTSPSTQISAVLASCGARVVVAGSAPHVAAVADAVAGARSGVSIISPAVTGRAPGGHIGWSAWLDSGRTALADSAVRDELSSREAAVDADDLAALIYTSGSTGEPKGARLRHRYLIASARSIGKVLGLDASDRSLSFLPYSHSAERIFGHYTRICFGMTTGLVPDHTKLWDAARVFQPTIFGGLPRFYEKLVEGLHDELDSDAGERTLALGRERSRLRRAGREVPAELESEWRREGAGFIDALRARFGGALRHATSGGAMLMPAVAETLDALGITVLGAYGMTEHLCVAFNRPDHYAFDAVGSAMPGTEIRIAADGEILVRRCALTFDGYHDDPAATAAAFTDDGEWLRTGDIGTLDAHGMLRVTGRRKELIALSTGKKVAPLPIEARLTQTPWIGQAVLYGEGRRFISALLTLRRALLEQWASARGVAAEWPALLQHPDVLSEVTRAIEEVNRDLSGPERVRRFVLLDRDLSSAHDELTPTLKIRRDVIAHQFRDRFDALYTEER
ncbi:MAG TPA: AMP-binding protein [Longimicrobiales bacterium]|nr:AMP-binding protein [Longimicrobiales bacterium]